MIPLDAMPADTIVVVTLIVAVFGLFGGVLAWGERQTRSIPADKRPSQDATKAQLHVDGVDARTPDKNAA